MEQTTTTTVTTTVTTTTAPVATHICMLLDRTGSMWGRVKDTIGGVNAFIAAQRKAAGACTFTLIQFDSMNPHEVTQGPVPIAQALDLTPETYQPRGNTPLYDAIGKAIAATNKQLGEDKTTKVVFVIITDGEENCSEEYTKATAAAAIKSCEDKGWLINYLGVGIDAMTQGQALGTKGVHTMNVGCTSQAVQSAFATTASNLVAYRGSGDARSLDYTSADRSLQAEGGAHA